MNKSHSRKKLGGIIVANYKKSHSSYRSTRKNKQIQHSAAYYKQRRKEDDGTWFIRRFTCQSMICLCVLMGILVVQKLPNTSVYETVKSSVMGNFPFAKYEQMYQNFLSNMLPFEFKLPTNEEVAMVNGGVSTTVDESGNQVTSNEKKDGTFDLQEEIKSATSKVALEEYENGVVLQAEQKSPIKSFVPGIVLNLGVDEKIGNYVNIQLQNEWVLTVGFLENREVSQYQHIKVGDTLGVGSVLELPGTDFEEEAFYYLALKDGEGKAQDVMSYLKALQ